MELVPNRITLSDSDKITIHAIAEIQRQHEAGKISTEEAVRCIGDIVEADERLRREK